LCDRNLQLGLGVRKQYADKHNKLKEIMRYLSIIIVSGLLCSHVLAETELKGTESELIHYLGTLPKTVSIVGEAEVKVPADKAVVSLKVTTENKSLQEALRYNQEVRGKVTSFLIKQGIPAERIRASRFSSTPKFGWFKEKAKSYRVENLVKVTVQDEKELQSAGSAVDTSPEVQFVGAEFEHDQKETLKAKVVAQACDNANEKRKTYEEKLGVKLNPVRFSGENVSQKLPALLGNYRSSSGYPADITISSMTPSAAQQPDASEVTETASSLGELVYAAQVTVEYSVQSIQTK
jgi:uncharacterized protein YggE